jgi:hypothetical protein
MKENYDEQIDRTLRLLGSANPSPGMEDRILVSIAQARTSSKPQRFFSLPQLAFGMSAAVMAGGLIVVGSVSHSRHMLPIAPGLHLPTAAQPGVGAASAAHVATQPVTSLPQDRPRSVRKTVNGRAVISPDAKRQPGVAVPKTLPAQ